MRHRTTATGSLLLSAALLATTAGRGPRPEPVAGCAAGSAAPAASLTPPTTLIVPGVLTVCVDIEYPPMEYFPSADVTDPARPSASTWTGRAPSPRRSASRWRSRTPRSTRSSRTSRRAAATSSGRACTSTRTASRWRRRALHGDRPGGDGPEGQPDGHRRAHGPVRQDGRHPERRPGRGAHQRAQRRVHRRGSPAINIQGYPKVADEFQQIILGRVDAIWETDSAVSDWMMRNPDQYEVAYALPRDDTYGIYYAKGNDRAGRRHRRRRARPQGGRHPGRDRGVVPDRPGHPGRDPVGRSARARRRPPGRRRAAAPGKHR